MAVQKRAVLPLILSFLPLFSLPLFAQQPTQTNVSLPPAVVSQALDVYAADKASGALTGKVTSISGSVKLRNVKTIFWDDLKIGQEVKQGDNIKTEKDGQVKIEFNNGNVLFLKANSQVLIKTLNTDSESGKYETVLKTNKGRIKAEVNDREHLKTFEIHTPVVVAGARGTVFYVNVMPGSSEVFVEKGAVAVRNIISGKEREIQTGLATTADKTGKIEEPAPPPPEKIQEFSASWEPIMSPPPVGPNGEPLNPPPPPGTLPPPPIPPVNMTDIVNNMQNQQMTTAITDRTSSQSADMTAYINNPPPPVGDTDGDWLNDSDEINVFHTNANLTDTDGDGLTDWEEVKAQKTNPLAPNTDGSGLDTLSDLNDAFPNDSAIYLESRANIRTLRYQTVGAVSGLRSEINTMLADANERQKDYLMDRISDAQMHKVMKDASGSWVRMEEYLYRPAPNKISVLSLAYRTSSQLTSMYWETTFQSSLDGLTSQQIRNLPWDTYLSTSPNYGAASPAIYPTQMKVSFERYLSSNNLLDVQRTYNTPYFDTGLTYYTQTSNEAISGVEGGSSFTGTSVTVPSGFIVPGNPTSFEYNWTGGTTQLAVFNMHIIDENGAYVGGPFVFDSIWTVLGANLPGFTSIGNNTYLEIRVVFNGQTWDVIYSPIRNLIWRGTSDWEPQLTWQ